MKKSERAARIATQLAELYPETPIPLAHTNPFELLVAVALSAQARDLMVNVVTPALFARAPDARTMAECTEEELLALIKKINLAPRKARALRAMAQMLMREHGGEVPRTFEQLEALPGVGHKTASVVMSQAFGFAAFPVDTHIHRLAARWRLSDGSNVVQTERDLKRLFPQNEWNKLHLRIIYFGREYCPALHHDAALCPICSWASTRASLALVQGPAR